MRNLYLKLACLVLFCCSLLPALAQNNYLQISSRIDSLSAHGLPKSALVEVGKLDKLARKNGSAAQIIRAAIYRLTFQAYLKENVLATNINTLKDDVRRSGYPGKPVLQSLLAETYWRYYQQNRWQMKERSRLLKPDPDFTRWDLATLLAKVSSLYQASLTNASQSQRTPVSVLDDVLTGDKNTRYLRPTLYDLLAHRALEFYLSDESSLNRPRDAFNLNDDRLLSDSRTFAFLKLKSTDTTAILYQGIKLLQQLTRLHLDDNNAEALTDVDLKRLQLVYNKSTTAQKDSLYENALKTITQKFNNKPISADAWVLLGRYYQANNSLIDAHKAYTTAKERFPGSIGGKNAAAGLSQLDEKTLSARVEEDNVPGRPMLALMTYKNVTAAEVKVFRLSVKQMQEYQVMYTKALQELWQSDMMPKQYQQKLREFFKLLNPVQQQLVTLPGKIDYRTHTTEFKLDAMLAGRYVLQVNGADTTKMSFKQYASFSVSNLAYTVRTTPKEDFELLVMHRYSGKPMSGINITVEGYGSRYSEKLKRNETFRKTYEGKTDKNGKYLIPNQQNGNFNFRLVWGNDTLTREEEYIRSESDNDDVEPEAKTILFTDRQIYRPGQTMYFKGLRIETFNRQTKIKASEEIELELKGANRKTLQKVKFTTNEFGTFAGSFIIPQNILPGDFELYTDDGDLTVKVEEYKRPTFKVEFKDIKETFRFNDSVRIKGTVMAFAGYGLTQARVAYRVQRTSNLVTFANTQGKGFNNRYAYQPPVEVATDTVTTDAQGNYTIRFKALPGDERAGANTIHQYQVTADVTDASGETHSGNTRFSIGTRDISLQASIPGLQWAKDSVKVPVRLTTLNNQPLKGRVHVQVYALQSPGRLFINRLWAEPEYYTLSASEYQNQFPDYAYRNQDQYNNWLVSATLGNRFVEMPGNRPVMVNLTELYKQPGGVYRVIIKAVAANGDTAAVTQYINLLQSSGKPAALANWLVPVKTYVKAGQQAEILAGTGTDAYILAERYRGVKMVSSDWMHSRGQQSLKVPVTFKDSDNVAMQYLMLYHNRLLSSYQQILMQHPEKQLDVKLTSFRNLLQPGQKEQWKLQVSGFKNDKQQAEVLASMYDASLDDVAPPRNWQPALELPNRQHRYYTWSGNRFIDESVTQSFINNRNYFNPVSRQYEEIDWLGYNYFGGYNSIYHNHLNKLRRAISYQTDDLRLETVYKSNAALIKNGYDISGVVTDEGGQTVPGVVVRINGTSIGTSTNSKGFYKIKVPAGDSLLFIFIGYSNQVVKITKSATVNVKLKPDGKALNEVVVVNYGVQKRTNVTGAVSTVYGYLAGVVPGVAISQDRVTLRELSSSPGTEITLRGNSSIAAGNAALFVIDGVITEQGGLTTVNPNDILSIDVLNGAKATALYGARGANGVVVVTTKAGAQSKLPIVIRKNFNETAFFYPQLHTDENGQVTIDFTIPEALTKWHFRALAHTPQLAIGFVQQDVITRKRLMISANMPRFLREGDTVTVSARVSNLDLQPVKAKVHLQLFNAISMQPVSLLANPADANQSVDLAANTNQAISFKVIIPTGLDALTYRLTASSSTAGDGEENTVPVLPNRMLVTESMPMLVRSGQSKAFSFDKLVNEQSKTLVNKTLTLEYTQNPAWYAVQALPYLMEFPYECSEQTFSRYLSNSLSAAIVNNNPRIKTIFERWKAADSKELLSNLEKNQKLKTALLEETPWLRDAMDEAEQKKRIALLFDLNKLTYEQEQILNKLQSKQLPGGGFPWFGGNTADRYITQHIVAGIGQLNYIGIAGDQKLNNIAGKAIAYLDAEILADAKLPGVSADYLSAIDIHAWYARSYFKDKPLSEGLTDLRAKYLNKAAKLWLRQDIYQQALIALTMQRLGKPEIAKAITRSLLERAQQSEDMGMYWPENRSGWYWYQSPVETQALLIELFTETGSNPKAVEEMKIWLLRNKQTTNWRTTKATAAACYALLMKGTDLLTTDDVLPAIILGGKPLTELKPDLKAEAGTGYLKTSWANEAVKPALGKVQISNNGKTVSWGALYWQYTEQLDKITPATADLKLERKYFIVKTDAQGKVVTEVDARHQPKVGDLLKVVVYLKAGRDYDYVHLKDMRPSGTEPVDVLSDYKYKDGLYYYQVTKDVATNFFISRLNKGSYVFEYELRVAQPGKFATGISTVQSVYAPEFSAHSEGRRLAIGK
ncbi:alpha-2-macroglobulin family protein [Mucilaginibacter sp. CSA2-8R]|uniref:alpha-2-macroglobulin family protein n=1 Tax=Mucilaginibacter sp. CSA2-8R TaxID=3141542 RepID=UPI00315D187E